MLYDMTSIGGETNAMSEVTVLLKTGQELLEGGCCHYPKCTP